MIANLETSGLLAQSLAGATALTFGFALAGVWWLYRRPAMIAFATAWLIYGVSAVLSALFVAVVARAPGSSLESDVGALTVAASVAAGAAFLRATLTTVGRQAPSRAAYWALGALVLASGVGAILTDPTHSQLVVRAGSRLAVTLATATCCWWLLRTPRFPGRRAVTFGLGLLLLRSFVGLVNGPLSSTANVPLVTQPLWFTVFQLMATVAAGLFTVIGLFAQERAESVCVATRAGEAERALLIATAEARSQRVAAAERLQLLVENINDLIFTLAADLRIAEVSPRAEAFLGVTPSEARGRDIASFVVPRDRDALLDHLRRVAAPGYGGGIVTVGLVSGRMIELNARMVTLEGSTVFFVAARDVTERMRLEGQLAHVERLDSLGMMAGGVAHDFNNVLQAILGFADLALRETNVSDDLREDLKEINRAASRGTALTQQLLLFSRRQLVHPVEFDAVVRTTDLMPMLRRIASHGVAVTCTARADAIAVRADPSQFDQMLVNMASNARDAMPTGGRLHIALDVVESCVDAGELPVGLPGGAYCRIDVSDSGSGMPAEIAAHIFEPFFTTKGPGKGTGLGLAGAYGFARQAGGTIAVDSVVGRGTVFRVYLPLVGETEAGSRKTEGSLKMSSDFRLPSGFGLPASGSTRSVPTRRVG